MTATVSAFLAATRAVVTNPAIVYDNPPSVARCHPDESGFCDCSGLCCDGYRKAGHDVGCVTSWDFARWGHQQGLGISIEAARHTPSLLLIGANEGQTNVQGKGHIGISPGNGVETWEARGHVAGVGVFPWNSLRWDYAMRLPYLEYDSPAPLPPTPPNRGQHMITACPIPGARAQTKKPWVAHLPMIGAVLNPNGTTDLVGLNGATIPGGTSAFGVSFLHLGKLNGPIVSIDPQWKRDARGAWYFTGWMVPLAEDGGTFAVKPTIHYL